MSPLARQAARFHGAHVLAAGQGHTAPDDWRLCHHLDCAAFRMSLGGDWVPKGARVPDARLGDLVDLAARLAETRRLAPVLDEALAAEAARRMALVANAAAVQGAQAGDLVTGWDPGDPAGDRAVLLTFPEESESQK